MSIEVVTNSDLIIMAGLAINFLGIMSYPIKIEKRLAVIETKLSPIYDNYKARKKSA